MCFSTSEQTWARKHVDLGLVIRLLIVFCLTICLEISIKPFTIGLPIAIVSKVIIITFIFFLIWIVVLLSLMWCSSDCDCVLRRADRHRLRLRIECTQVRPLVDWFKSVSEFKEHSFHIYRIVFLSTSVCTADVKFTNVNELWRKWT